MRESANRFTPSPPPPPNPDGPQWPTPPQWPGSPQWPGPAPGFYPITIGRGVSLAFHMFRFGWRTFVSVTLLAYLPLMVVDAAMTYLTYPAMSQWQQSILPSALAGYNQSQLWASFPWWTFAASLAVGFLVAIFATIGQAAIVDAIATAMNGGRLSTMGSLHAAIDRLPSLLAIYLVLSLVTIALGVLSVGVPLISVLPALGISGGPLVFLGLIAFVAVLVAVAYVTIRFTFGVMTLMVEHLPAVTALRRSWYLLGGSMLRVLGWALVFGLILGLIGVVVSFIGLVVSFVVSPPQLQTIAGVPTFGPQATIGVAVETLITTLLSALFAPVITIGLTLLYFEIRWRHGETVPEPAQPASSRPFG